MKFDAPEELEASEEVDQTSEEFTEKEEIVVNPNLCFKCGDEGHDADNCPSSGAKPE